MNAFAYVMHFHFGNGIFVVNRCNGWKVQILKGGVLVWKSNQFADFIDKLVKEWKRARYREKKSNIGLIARLVSIVSLAFRIQVEVMRVFTAKIWSIVAGDVGFVLSDGVTLHINVALTLHQIVT